MGGIENSPHFTRQGVERERLLQEYCAFIQHVMVLNRVFRVSRDKQDLYVRMSGGNPAGQLATADARHANTRDHHVNTVAALRGDFERLFTAAGLEHRVAVAL